MIGGVVAAVLGFLWGIQFPLIKKVWTSSYVLVTGGYSCLLLAGFYQVIEIWDVRRWAAPFVWIGMNAIAIYLLSGLVGGLIHYSGFVAAATEGFLGNYAQTFASLVYTGVMVLIAYGLFRRKLFIRL